MEPSVLLAEAVRVWTKSQVVLEGEGRTGETEPNRLVRVLAGFPECHDGLVELLNSPNQLVVAHALRALELMESPLLARMPDELCARRQNLTVQIGSIKTSIDLGGFARGIRDRASRKS